MLPIALTCPPWWVARWTVRMLTSLAVALAFSLGAASLPFDAAAPAEVAGPAASAWSPPPPPSPVAGLSPAAAPGADSAVGGVDAAVAPARAASPSRGARPVLLAAGSPWTPTGSTPAASGPRAPSAA